MKIIPVKTFGGIDKGIAKAKAAGGGALVSEFRDGDIFAVTGHTPQIDEAYCTEHGIKIYRMQHLFGPVVIFPGDLTILTVTDSPFRPSKAKIAEGIELLRGQGIDAHVTHNDLIADEKKVGSWLGHHGPDGWYLMGVHFSINTDAEMVRRICRKRILHEPGALSDYAITADMIWQWLKGE